MRMGLARTVAAFIGRHRRRLARLVLALGVVVAVVEVYPSFPRDTEVELLLGSQRERAVELRVAYVHEGEELRGVSFGFPQGAPDRVRHTVRLPSGTIQVRMELRKRDGASQFWTRKLRTPADGTVRFDLAGGTS